MTTAVRTFVPLTDGGTALDAAEESTLVGLACEGDKPAFAELVRRHQGRVRGLLMRLAQDRVLADDLAQ